jgi:hypothetical protein
VRPVLVECLCIAALAAGRGFGLATLGVTLIDAAFEGSKAYRMEFNLDGRVPRPNADSGTLVGRGTVVKHDAA